MKHKFHPDAAKEYGDATRWYADRDLQLAFRFIEAVEETISRVVDAPTRWRVIEEDVRRCLTRVFPYAVHYTIESDFILVVAVSHCSREPGYWRDRITKP